MDKIKVWDIVEIKEDKAFEYSVIAHFGVVADINEDQFQIKMDNRYTQESFAWVNVNDYNVIGHKIFRCSKCDKIISDEQWSKTHYFDYENCEVMQPKCKICEKE